ncbi:chloramphenicol acetyltransferase [Flavobacterium sp. GSP27]|uniref:chloramphenicol acetyltransferase n=1 Tax=unclassified Flavobacterium TaxID=196869 RepID=UPI000F848869|nr:MULTISPECIES: chloramphenicol acetyltransferase [unclassified Flavobacterium]RTY76255.1 chloramphenicol acetyltransferase [Flavobacterium sp. LS1R10]RTY96441.1 chloramphenicol acetyltransferase [Flavobacterium sp. GSN2]RTZ11062.1 chloramphenicol acetyltransferase [Flavobacterium sp. GSP27]
MRTLLDIENWPRKEHFHFFRQFEEPFFGATVKIDCTKAYAAAKALNSSFFNYYLHQTLVAVNTIESFKYRVSEDQIYICDQINASATIGREDGTFGFSLIEYNADFAVFKTTSATEIARIQTTTGLFTRTFEEDNVIHFSAIPWLDFSSLSHARSFSFPDSCPKISFGKMKVSPSGKRTMPMSVHVHHGLMDGFHLGQFVDCFQELMNQ